MRISDWSSDVCSSDLLHGDSPERSVAPMTGVLERYQQLIIAEELRTDTDQQAAAQRLDALQKELEAAPPRGSTLWKMLRRAPPPPRGLYMWGGVGRGKSMLMDLFFDSLDIRRKRRVHFPEFMIEETGRANV